MQSLGTLRGFISYVLFVRYSFLYSAQSWRSSEGQSGWVARLRWWRGFRRSFISDKVKRSGWAVAAETRLSSILVEEERSLG